MLAKVAVILWLSKEIIPIQIVGATVNPCSASPNTFFNPLQQQGGSSTCVPVPTNAAPTADGLGWACVDGTVGTYGLRKYNLPCTSYSFSSTLGNAAPCAPYASPGLSEGYTTYGWCVSCQINGNCPGAWAQVDLGLVGSVAGVYVSGRAGFCNFPLTLSAKSSMDGVTWTDVDGGNVFSTGMTADTRCVFAGSSYVLQKPLVTIRFAAPLMARYLRVYPLTHAGFGVWNTYGAYAAWWMCMQFEPLAVSPDSSNLVVMYPFNSAATLAQGYGYLPSSSSTLSGPFTDSSWTGSLGGGLILGVGQVAYSPFIDFSDFSEFTVTYWTSVETYVCNPSAISFGLVDESGKVFYGVAPCFGTSMMKMTFDSTKSFNCFGCGQDPYRKNRQTLHGRRSGNGTTNYFWFGQGGGVDASNGMSSVYEIFNLPKWPGKLRFRFGSPGHKYIIKMHDVRLYRDSSLTGVNTGTTGSVPMDVDPTTKYLPSMDSCAVCQPGFYCANNQVFACPANSSAGYHASAISQCVCNAGLFKDPVLGCRACRSGFYCPNENSEVACSVGCSNTVGVLYQSSSCSSAADRVCTACPSTSAAATAMGVVPAACVCPANSYNNGTGLGCSVCPQNSVSAAHSYGLGACSCVSGFFNTPTVDNATGRLLALACTLCLAGTYSLANTQVCFPYPANTVASDKSPLGFFCPNGYFMPTDVPVMINASTGYPTRPGLIYWNFESTSFSVMKNEWGNYSLTNYIPPKIFPESTTADIKALNPNAQCKFGTRCALIGGTSSAIYKYTLTIPPFTMPAKGISVSFWFRINSCQSCGIYELSTTTIGVESWNFAGVSAKHDNLNSNLYFAYNGISTAGSHSYWSLTNTWDGGYAALKNSWHHYLYTFLPGGNFSGYIDGIRRASKLFNKEFPSTVTGSFFLPNYYNGMVDDFAIFEGDVAPYLSNLLTKPANQALDGTGIAAACVPCFNGMYCNNNTATTCPNNKTNALPLSSWETDCQCNEPGKSGNGNFTTCSTLCPANSYCLGGGYPPQPCPVNQLSLTNASLLSDCTCPAIYELDALGNCGCPTPISTTSKAGGCTCNPGFIASASGSYVSAEPHPGLRLCGGVNNKYCSHTTLGYDNYVYSTYYPMFLFDDDQCSSMSVVDTINRGISPGQLANSILRIDLQEVYFIQNMSYIGVCGSIGVVGFWLGVSTTTDLASVKYLYASPTSIPAASYSTVNGAFVVPTSAYIQIPAINSHARYIYIKSFGSTTSYLSLSDLKMTAFKASCSYCDAGYFCPTNSSSDKQPCTAGYYCPPGSVAPIPCGYNKYSLQGASSCTPCPSYIAITDVTTASSPTQCRCPGGFSGNASLSLIPVSQYAVNVGPGIVSWDPWKKVNGKWSNTNFYTPGTRPWDQFPSFGPVTCETPVYVQYDLQAVYPLSQILASPQYGIHTPCGLYLKLSLSGEFTGEETTVFQCPLTSSCQPYSDTLYSSPTGYLARFPTQYARYVRFYVAGDESTLTAGNFITNFYVYQCIGPECSSCVPCTKNFYCPGTVERQEAYPCPNSTYTYADGAVGLILKGPSSVSECSCPSNARIQEGNTFCTCNAGYYYQQNTSDALQHVGWQCVPCPYNTTSLPGALNYSECFCSGGLQSVSLSPSTSVLPDTAIIRFTAQAPSSLTVTSNPNFTFSAGGNLNNLNDGSLTRSNDIKYPYVNKAMIPWVTPQFWLQYDLKGIYPITKIIARTGGIYNLIWSSYSFKISTTGAFSGEEDVVFSCGHTLNVWCPFFTYEYTIGNIVSFPVKYGRYVRWYTGASDGAGANTSPLLLQFSVYYANQAYKCTSCSSNSYCPSKVINQTFKCPNSTFSFVGASSVSQCVCPANAAVQSGTTNCSCNGGYYYSTNATALLNAGWQCNACPPNLLSPIGSTSITQCICVAGYYPTNPLVSMQECSICPLNTYCPFESIAPVPCPPGTTSNNSLGAIAACTTPCPPGFYCPGDTQILPCPLGTYSTGGAQTACTTCEGGYFCNTTVKHILCPQGFYCQTGTVNPIPCASTTYSNVGASVCTNCEVGYYCPTVFGHTLCPVINFCPEGSTSPLPCEPGLYACAGSGVCAIQCPPGGYCPGNGTVIACPLGSFSNGGASDAGCTPCPEGFFCDFSLQLTAAKCV